MGTEAKRCNLKVQRFNMSRHETTGENHIDRSDGHSLWNTRSNGHDRSLKTFQPKNEISTCSSSGGGVNSAQNLQYISLKYRARDL
jgi:hypothetical protein